MQNAYFLPAFNHIRIAKQILVKHHYRISRITVQRKPTDAHDDVKSPISKFADAPKSFLFAVIHYIKEQTTGEQLLWQPGCDSQSRAYVR
jgi:hypothetical protein